MRACIQRGATEIGGTLIELEAQGKRLVLEAGLPLDLEQVPEHELLPDVPGLWADSDGSLLGLLISHGHPDHYGLADLVAPSVPIFIGERAAAILGESAFFVPSVRLFPISGHLRHSQAFQLGPFEVTPWLVDHSAFDAYALIVEADNRRLVYTGDLRAHGRKPSMIDDFAQAAAGTDALVIEGTRIGRDSLSTDEVSERDVEAACLATFRATAGIALVFFSPQNIDRLVTFYRAAKRAGRVFVMDLYTAAIAAATGRETIPQADWENVRVYLPHAQRRRVIAAGAFERTDAVREHRIYPEELRKRASEIVLICRGSMLRELGATDCLDGASAIWSMWPGYLAQPSGQRTADDLRRLNIPLTVHHASGHASPADLERLARGINASRVVPIHTEAPASFADYFANVAHYKNGEWWQV